MISKGRLYHNVRVKDFEADIPPIESVPVVKVFLEVLRDDLPGIPPEWKIDLSIDLLSDTNPISIPTYQMSRAEFK